MCSLTNGDCGAGGSDHEHAVVGAENFVVDVDTYYSVSTKTSCTLFQFFHSVSAGLVQFLFIGVGAATDDVADACKEIFDEIDAGNDFAEYDAMVFYNLMAFYGGGGCDNHENNLSIKKKLAIADVECFRTDVVQTLGLVYHLRPSVVELVAVVAIVVDAAVGVIADSVQYVVATEK